MDYALLAATALGAIGLYLLLPRERAPIARLGLLLGALALAGLFLFLIRVSQTSAAAEGGAAARPPVYFYVFSGIMIAGAVGVVCQPRPVYAALYFVLVTLAGAGLFVLLLADFMAVVLIIIYAGAILVTYVFVIMLASQGSTGSSVVAPYYDRRAIGGLPAIVAAFVLVGAVLQVLLPSRGTIATANFNPFNPMYGQMIKSANAGEGPNIESPSATSQPAAPSNVQLIGASLYSQYSMSLELAGILLTIALIGAVVIARKNTSTEQPLGTGKLPSE
jgi:NADH-quinone oxidoreductase subunit J